MKKNTIAILHHSVQSKDLKKQHRFCPPGPDSWCKWQQDQALGTSTTDHGVKVVRAAAAASAVCHFRSGASIREKVMQRLGIPAGDLTRRSLLLKDKKRLRKPNREKCEKSKRRRQAEQTRKPKRKKLYEKQKG